MSTSKSRMSILLKKAMKKPRRTGKKKAPVAEPETSEDEVALEDESMTYERGWTGLGKVYPGDRHRKGYYVEFEGESQFAGDIKAFTLNCVEFLIDTFGRSGVELFCSVDEKGCILNLSKKELKIVRDNPRVVSTKKIGLVDLE